MLRDVFRRDDVSFSLVTTSYVISIWLYGSAAAVLFVYTKWLMEEMDGFSAPG